MAMSSGRKAFLIIGGLLLAVVLVSILGLAIFFYSASRGPSVASNSVLVLKITGDLPDFAPDDPTAALFGGEQKESFATLLTQLRKAKVDQRVGGIFLDVNFPGIGWGKADELREAVADFKASGKPVYAYMEIGTNLEYYIASSADKIYLPPSGDLFINGFASEATFYKGTLDKWGIDYDNVAMGKYKSANDRFVRKDLSEGQREVTNAILDDYFGRFIAAIAEARKKTPDEIKAVIDTAPHRGTNAAAQNLIDGAMYRDQVLNEFKKHLGYKDADELNLLGNATYKEVTPESLGLNNGERVAVIFATGLILSGRSSDGSFGGTQTIGSDTISRAVRDAADDTTVKAIVLRVDSGGGSALASDIMYHAIEYAKSKNKPVVTSMGDVAASGGYYIAANSDKIVAEPSTITGSIGVIIGKPSFRGLYEYLGVTTETISRGKNAGLFSVADKWTPEQRALFERQAEMTYRDEFIPKVAKGRGKTNEQVHEVAQGRVWTGFQAKEKGLIDEFGGLNKAVEIAKQLANLPADKDVKRVIFPAPRPFFETIFSPQDDATVSIQERQEMANKQALINALPKDAQKVFRYAAMFDQMKPGESLALMPFELTIK